MGRRGYISRGYICDQIMEKDESAVSKGEESDEKRRAEATTTLVDLLT